MGKAHVAAAAVVLVLALVRVAVTGVPKNALDQGIPDTSFVSGPLFRRLINADVPLYEIENGTCQWEIQQKYRCSETACEDLVPGTYLGTNQVKSSPHRAASLEAAQAVCTTLPWCERDTAPVSSIWMVQASCVSSG
jgi:hypothetical protein